MKALKAKQLPSGSWRVQIMVNGEKISVTESTEEAAILKAMNIKHGVAQHHKEPLSITLNEAYSRYIESKDAILSPSTIAGYKRLQRTSFQSIMIKPLRSLSTEQVQRDINQMAKNLSPKSLRNAHGLLNSVLKDYHPDFVLRTTLPQKEKVEIVIPSEIEIKEICVAAKGTKIELPILLAVWLGLRASEICGIRWDAIKGSILHVKEAKVYANNQSISKATKTFSGNRKIELPTYLINLINEQPKVNDYIVQLSGQAIYKRFVRLCERNNLPHFRFHDLRHANASVMLALGVPDKYAQERMGHATNNMLKTVYQHTMDDKRNSVNNAVNSYFEDLISHESSHE